MKGLKTVYNCSECGYTTAKWLGKCPSCGAWDSFVEDVIDVSTKKDEQKKNSALFHESKGAVSFADLEMPEYIRFSTELNEFDRVLGGGLVKGSVVLISGEPGIGKSTLLMQVSDSLGKSRRVLYISGEESGAQLKLRAKRLGVNGNNLYILTESDIDNIIVEIEKVKPDIIIADSIQTLYNNKISATAGSVSQIKECAMTLINIAKAKGISVILVGHVNKEGGIAGPKILEHMVDAVLYFEGDREQIYRIIRAIKNRYGSTNEIGVFEMADKGLLEVPNPSEMLLEGRPTDIPGNCAVCALEGTRPIIAEIQALVSSSVFPAPRRTSNGIDYNRMCLILAVLEKRLGLRFSANDVYLNVIGGLHLNEPASDLSVALALISSITDRVIPDEFIAMGELGLSGECRAVSCIDQRIKEAKRLGFTSVIVPSRNLAKYKENIPGIKIIPIKSVYDCLKILKPKEE